MRKKINMYMLHLNDKKTIKEDYLQTFISTSLVMCRMISEKFAFIILNDSKNSYSLL